MYRNDDMTFCSNTRGQRMNCDRNPKHIMHPELPHSYSDFEGTKYCLKAGGILSQSRTSSTQIDPGSDLFGDILICAVRYAIGRQTYMPSLVIGFIRPLLPELNDNKLFILERDIREAPSYGDETIDKPDWLRFLKEIQQEQERRKTP